MPKPPRKSPRRRTAKRATPVKRKAAKRRVSTHKALSQKLIAALVESTDAGIIGKTLIAHGSEKLKAEFLPKILKNEVEFAVGYSEPNAGSDAGGMSCRAEIATRRDDATPDCISISKCLIHTVPVGKPQLPAA